MIRGLGGTEQNVHVALLLGMGVPEVDRGDAIRAGGCFEGVAAVGLRPSDSGRGLGDARPRGVRRHGPPPRLARVHRQHLFAALLWIDDPAVL